MATPPASVGVPLEEVAWRGVGEIFPRIRVVATRLVGEDKIEAAGGGLLVEIVGCVEELLGSKGFAS